jgi:hypothetical protein
MLHAVGSFEGELLYRTNLVFYFYALWVFFLPMQLLHDWIRIGRRNQLIWIDRERNGLFERFLTDAKTEGDEELDRIRDRTRDI